ncbi:MAG: hypothetical protein Q9167_006786 [Letrouitia subvulpina]
MSTARRSASESWWSPICPHPYRYRDFAKQRGGKDLSKGRHRLPFQRPHENCRAFQSPEVEATIARLRKKITDPDLFRLFENSYPNSLDTAVLWTGFAFADGNHPPYSDEDLAFVITGDMSVRPRVSPTETCADDIDLAMLYSANQILSYLPLLKPSSAPKSIAALFRGVINLHSRYIKFSPYCHAFQPPPESGIPNGYNIAYHRNKVKPPYSSNRTFDCKWELDSLASFLQISSEYYNATGDLGPFSKYQWMETVEIILDTVEAMRTATYMDDGQLAPSGYTMTGHTNRATETTSNDGLGNPVKRTGMIRSTFRPSDDATIYQFLIPSNMMFARYLDTAIIMMEQLKKQKSKALVARMRKMAVEIREGISKHGIVYHSQFGAIFAYEVDGFGSQNLMDDANLPSLLSASMIGFVSPRDEVYLNTRLFALSEANPYWMHGPVLSAIGGPHNGPVRAWPLASIVRILTSQDGSGEEAREELRAILNSTDGLGRPSSQGVVLTKKVFMGEWDVWTDDTRSRE